MTNRAEELIADLEAEIAQRDARIEALEVDIVYLKSVEKERNALRDELAALKAQQPRTGVVLACQICKDSGAVSTTDKDHNGDHIEMRCPVCSAGAVDERAAFEQEFPRSHHAPAVYWCEERQRYVGHGDAFENNGSAYQHKFENWKKARARLDQPTASAGVVLPERKVLPDLMMASYHEAKGYNDCLDEIARLNPCRAKAVPDGWKMVPVEPTPAMLLASKRYKRGTKIPTGPGFYRAMLAAAPSTKKESGDEQI